MSIRKKYSKTLIIISSLLLCIILYAQPTQSIRGILIDNDNKNAITRQANISIELHNQKELSTSNNEYGRFELDSVPIGRHILSITCEGYKSYQLPVVMVSGESFYVEANLIPNINTLSEVKVSDFNKSKTLNTMATTSVRSFNMEETERYAGAFGDPARMVQRYAGVSSAADGRNDIIIRGNSPYGILWRVDNVDIANPNHFGAKGSTGGPVTILNNNFLSNSDFFMSAFPAEYGNAFSGVFDLKMREGNYKRYEKMLLLGWNGVGAGISGPIQKDKSSFIAGYRYANFGIFKLMHINIGLDGVPIYQDLTIKTNFQTKKAGNFSWVFIGGMSEVKTNRGKMGMSPYSTLFDINNKNKKIITFVNHSIKLDEKSNLKSFIGFSIDQNFTKLDSPKTNTPSFVYAFLNETDIVFSLGSTYRRKINTKNIIETGLRLYMNIINYIDSQYYILAPNHYFKSIIKRNNLWQSYAFAQWKHNFSNNLFSTLGVNVNYLFFNNTSSIDPRAGISYSIGKHTLGAGYGLVSKPLPFIIYFMIDSVSGKLTNLNLGFFKSHQVSLSDNWSIAPNFRIRTEVYYQYLFNIPVTLKPSSFSLINFGADYFQERPSNLTNKGKGQNYGIEITIEKFLSQHWYLLSTISLFQSKYWASDGIWRNTQFDANYIFNLIGGYEFEIGKKLRLQLNNSIVVSGGRPLSSYNADGTINDQLVYTSRAGVYFRDDVRIALTINSEKKMSQEIGLDFLNITANKNEYMRVFNPKTQQEQITYQMGFLPMINYRIIF